MIIALRRLFACGAILSLATIAAAQATPVTALDKQLDRLDLGIGAIGVITKSTAGPYDRLGTELTDTPSSTVGALITLRYTKSPLIGLELNYTYARFTQEFVGTNIGAGGTPTLGLQANMSEYTLGWVFHTPKVFGIGTFASAGAGTTAFKPSKNGGEGFQEQARMTYYYNVGVEQQVFSPRLGVRASFRQAFYNAPDFETNYLRNHQRTITSEPAIGIYLHF